MFLFRYLPSPPRYRSYILLEPLGGSVPHKQKPRRVHVPRCIYAALAGLFIASVVFNIVHLVRSTHTPPVPLDDFQQLKTYPLLNESAIPSLSEDAWHSAAVVTTLYSDSYAPAVATLGHSLHLVHTSARLVLLYIPSKVSAEALCLATSSGFVAYPVERIPPPADGRGMLKHFADQYTKLRLWSLDALPDPITSLVYIDSDTLVLRNFDELFSLPYNFAAAPDVWLGQRGFTLDFNAGVVFLRPDSELFDSMLAALEVARYPPGWAEQAFLNQYFATDVLRLPLAYNGNIAIKRRAPKVWDSLQDEMRVVHYTMAKPFLSRSGKGVPLDHLEERVRAAAEEHEGLYREEVLQWGDMWREARRVYADELRKCMIY
ncbi:glycosyltransferase family 8 protein [Phanerochaete carnosa HHB-10118-sp]|uniref:Glycosyltransferase family 8 protein n=1 Tax=Phanerochaete carnosa (strain HHB-10118-sp) TaxID=650164 RepID=K5WJY7_PHACS|nr:glycosyltransferase family 8 protein [Phanerochaete carnosa HHB-10118-sp]EKM50577.1 glycosyltransferase family 8 protein [Phanerochaete carnosa HHB-10118-sp]